MLSELPPRFVSIDTYPRAFSAAVVADMLNDNLFLQEPPNPAIGSHTIKCLSWHSKDRAQLSRLWSRLLVSCCHQSFSLLYLGTDAFFALCPWASACVFEGSTICTVCLVSPYRLGVSFCRTLGPDCFLCFPSPTYFIPHPSPICYS